VCYKGKNKKTVTSSSYVREQRFIVFAILENQKTFLYNTINVKNWLTVYLLPTKMLRVLSKQCYCDVTFGNQRYPIFFQFMHNAFLGKVRLNQGKIIFRLKVIS